MGRILQFSDIHFGCEHKRACAAALDYAHATPNDLVLITDPSFQIEYVNKAFVTVTGYELEEVLGRHPRFLHGRKTPGTALDRLRACMRTGRAVRAELVNYRKDGTPFWIDLSVVPVPDIAALNAVGRVILMSEASAVFERYNDRRDEFGTDVRTLFDQGQLLAATDYVNAQRLRRQFRDEFLGVFDGIDVLLTPTAPTVASARPCSSNAATRRSARQKVRRGRGDRLNTRYHCSSSSTKRPTPSTQPRPTASGLRRSGWCPE
jgi:PAS domain S-box-containing protein